MNMEYGYAFDNPQRKPNSKSYPLTLSLNPTP